MRTIERTGQFKKDFKREAKGKHRATLDADLRAVLVELVADRLSQQATGITRCPEIGGVTATATSNPTSY